MDCPVCQEAMIVCELDQVEIDHCVSCGGIWLDAGELELLLGSGAGQEDVLHVLSPETSAEESPRPCPICLKPMEKVLCAGKDKNILLDRCRFKDGLWFDKGELKDVLEAGNKAVNSKILMLLQEIFRES